MREDEEPQFRQSDTPRLRTTPPLGSNTESLQPILPQQFELLDVLGEGGMGIVYKARDQLTRRIVAIKMLKHSSNPIALQRFQREAQATCAFTHPNVVRVLSFDVYGETPYLVMEFVEGVTLGDRLDQRGALSEPDVISIFRGVCAGLARAHTSGIVHRDLKPGNIILSRDEERETTKILDFGIAKMIDADAQAKLTQTGEVFGTPLYMSPEQLKGEKIDARSDVYSVGAVIYHCLAGEPPHQGDGVFGIMYKRLSDKPEPFAKLKKKVSPSLERVVMKCLELDPSKRYANAGELFSDIDRCQNAGIIQRVVAAAQGSRSRSSKPIKIAVGTGLIVLIAAGAMVAIPQFKFFFKTSDEAMIANSDKLHEHADDVQTQALTTPPPGDLKLHSEAVAEYAQAISGYRKYLDKLGPIAGDTRANNLKKRELIEKIRSCLKGVVPYFGENRPKELDQYSPIWRNEIGLESNSNRYLVDDATIYIPMLNQFALRYDDTDLQWNCRTWLSRDFEALMGAATSAISRSKQLESTDPGKANDEARIACELIYQAMKSVPNPEHGESFSHKIDSDQLAHNAAVYGLEMLRTVGLLFDEVTPTTKKYFAEVNRMNRIDSDHAHEPAVYQVEGRFYEKRNHPELALTAYKEGAAAAIRHPNRDKNDIPDIFIRLSRMLFQKGNDAEAEKAFETALQESAKIPLTATSRDDKPIPQWYIGNYWITAGDALKESNAKPELVVKYYAAGLPYMFRDAFDDDRKGLIESLLSYIKAKDATTYHSLRAQYDKVAK